VALNQLVFQVGVVAGPAMAGIVISQTDLAAAYWIDVATFAVALASLLAMAPMVPEGGGTRFGLSSVAEGWRFLQGHRAIQGTMVIDINAMVFGMPRTLFPELGTEVFAGGPTTVGLLYAAPGAGALIGAIASGWLERVDRQGRAVLWAVVLWGAAVTGFGFAPWLWLALLLLAVAGWADVVSAVFRNTILQISVPDRLRGRLSSIHIAVVTGGPRLGDVESGTVAALSTARISAWSGGLACMAGVAVVAQAIPELGRWRLRDQPDPV
jgi:predicted MFS family arabinose efflux permease